MKTDFLKEKLIWIFRVWLMEKFDNILNKKIEMLRERDERSRILFEGKDSEMNENLSERFTNSDGL